MFKQMSRGLMSLLALSAVALSACSSMPTFTGYNHTSIPNVPYVNLDVHKQAHQMTTTDRACIFNGGDMITDHDAAVQPRRRGGFRFGCR